MNRRRFLGLLGIGSAGIALSEAIPLGRVWSFPKQILIAQPASVRFVRAWDVMESKMLNRFDVLYGLCPEILALPKHIERMERIEVHNEYSLPTAIKMLADKYGIDDPSEHFSQRRRDDKISWGTMTIPSYPM